MSSWQLIFQQSKVNNGVYNGDRFPAQHWEWPRETWFQTRLALSPTSQPHLRQSVNRAELAIALPAR